MIIPKYKAISIHGKEVTGQLLVTVNHRNIKGQKVYTKGYWIVNHATDLGGWIAVGVKHKVDPSTIVLVKQ